MDLSDFFTSELTQHREVLEGVRRELGPPFAQIAALCKKSLEGGGKILLFGNGGSAADAQHLAAELTIRYKQNRAPLAAIALTTDTSALTAGGNDFGFSEIFVRQVQALGRSGDIALGISTSGNSENVNKALKAAGAMGLTAIGLSGRDGGAMAKLTDPCLIVPSHDTARIQEMHITLGHMLCGALEQDMELLQ